MLKSLYSKKREVNIMVKGLGKVLVIGLMTGSLLAGCGVDLAPKDSNSVTQTTQNVDAADLIDGMDITVLEGKLEDVKNGARPEGWDPAIDNKEELSADAKIDFSKYTKISVEELDTGTHVVFVGRPTCIYCNYLTQTMVPVLEQLGTSLKYVNTDALNDTDRSNFIKHYAIHSVPQVLIIKDGKIMDSIDYVIEDHAFVLTEVEHPNGKKYEMEQPKDVVPAYADTFESLATRLVDMVKQAKKL